MKKNKKINCKNEYIDKNIKEDKDVEIETETEETVLGSTEVEQFKWII